MDDADALAALESSTAEPNVQPQAPTPAAPATTPEPTVESFTSVDRNSLTPELQVVWDNMNKDYTQKNQAVAEYRKLFEGVENPQEIRDAYEFFQSLNSDVDFAKDIYKDLGEALKPYLGDGNEPAAPPAPEFNDDSSDPRVSELEKRLAQFEEQQRFAAGAAELQRQEMALRSMYKDENWSDQDMEVAYEIAASMDGNLKAAGERWHELKNSVISDYINTKASVNPNLAPTPPGANAIQPVEINSTKDAHNAAVEYLQQVLGAEEG